MTEFRSREFGDGNALEAVALVAGFDGKIAHFEHTAKDLMTAGKDVVVYEYDNDVFLAGVAENLPTLITDLTEDFQDRTKDHPTHRFAGASMGGGIAWNMQREHGKSQPGIYAAIGANTAHLVMSNPLFRGVVRYIHKIDPKKEFERNGYTEADLWREWEHLHIPPPTGFAAVLGRLDYIIRPREVMPKFEAWSREIDIRLLTKRRLGHTGVIKWFSNNTPIMLQHAPDYSDRH